MSTFDEYQRQSRIANQTHANNKEEVMHWAIGLGEEAGEVLSVVKHKYYGGQYSVEDMIEELGDVLWYVATMCTACGLSLDDVADYNVAKLLHRYPDMEFDEQRSKTRHQLAGDFRQSEARNEIMSRVLTKARVIEKSKLEV